MKVTELNQLLFELEDKFPVQEWAYGDMDIWPVIRCSFKRQVLEAKKTPKIQIIKSALLRLTYSLFYSIKTVFKANKPADILFISTSVNYRFQNQGKLFDYYLDPIKAEFQNESYSCATVGIYCEDFYKALPKEIKFNDIFRYAMALAPFREELLHTPQFSELIDYCQKRGEAINWSAIKKRLAAELRYASLFQNQLKKIRPQLIFVSCYAGKWGMILAAKREGIPFIDVQHGVQGSLHAEYNRWKWSHNTLPDVFWNWTQEDKERIESWNGKAFLGGHPLFRAMSKKLITFSENHDPEKRVLVSLQVGISWHFIKPLLESPAHKYYIRLHPATPKHEHDEIVSYLCSLKHDKADYLWSSKTPLPMVLEHSFVHITYFSSIVIEAAMMGIPSICMDDNAAEFYKEYLARGLVTICQDEKRIEAEIDKAANAENEQAFKMNADSLEALWALAKQKSQT